MPNAEGGVPVTDVASAPAGEAVDEIVHMVVDGTTVEARPGELIIEAAERAGVYIPRFCYHPRMEPVGMCRMCLVEVSGPRGFSLQPACYLRVAEGQEIRTETIKARKAQEGVLEFLLVNHPLDCPVCDKGGECPLQDQALSHGPGESRFIEEKRHWDKPIEIGPLVYLDRERCIQCARCTRFADEIAGEALIDFAFRGSSIEVSPFPDQPFTSYFSGNTIQICPVGALTAPAYRFKSRPWDLEQVETTCTSCSVGCRVVAQSSAGTLVRYLGVDVDAVNQSWLCDKGRYGFEAINAPNRLSTPLVRRDGALVPTRWHDALSDVAAGTRQALASSSAHPIGVIGGARLSNEDAYAWSKLARTVFASDDVDAQLGDGLAAHTVLGLPRATIDEAARAKVIVMFSGDVREELPVLFLRLREAAKNGTQIIECSPVETAISSLAALRLAYRPGEAAQLAAALGAPRAPGATAGVSAAAIRSARTLLGTTSGRAGDRGAEVVVILGRGSLAESASSVEGAAAILAEAFPQARFLPGLRRANVLGALDMGLAPGLLPGRVALETGREWFAAAWGHDLPSRQGLDTAGILAAAASGQLQMLVLLGADPIADFPDRALALKALQSVPFLVAVGTHSDASSEYAHVVLPVAGDGERSGTTTNLEGRVSRLAAKVIPPGVAWPAWTVASEIARRLGGDLAVESIEDISSEIERFSPAYRGITADILGQPSGRDGLVAPVPATPVAIGRRHSARPIDPMATPGIASVEEQGAPLRVGSATPLGGEATVGDTAVGDTAVGDVVGAEKSGAEVNGAGSQTPRALDRPALLARPAAGEPGEVPELEDGLLRLVARRALYDHGTLVAACPSLAPLARTPSVAVHPAELKRLGVEPGASARLRAGRGDLVVEVVADNSIPRQIAVIGANPSSGLVSSNTVVTDVRLEAL